MSYTIKLFEERVQGEMASLRVDRHYYVEPYTAIPEVMEFLLGGYRLIGGRLIYILGHQHPLFKLCRCSSVSSEYFDVPKYDSNEVNITGLAGLDRIGNPDKGVLIATYTMPNLTEQRQNSDGGDHESQMDIASEQWEFAGKSISKKNEFYRWIKNGKIKDPKGFEVAVTFPQITCQVTRHRCLSIPGLTIGKLQNTINLSEFRIINTILPAETVKFDGLTANRKITLNKGLQFYEITYKFSIQLTWGKIQPEVGDVYEGFVGWNRQLNPETSKWEGLVHGATNEPHYIHDELIFPLGTANGKPIRGLQYLFHPQST
jgi:hypothetical protein